MGQTERIKLWISILWIYEKSTFTIIKIKKEIPFQLIVLDAQNIVVFEKSRTLKNP